MINENIFAKRISEREGKKINVDIAQIKEVLRITLDALANDYFMWETVKLIEKHKL